MGHSEIIESLKNQIISYCSGKPEIATCYLFGSYAAGTHRSGSDLDIAFLLDDAMPRSFYNDFRFLVISELGKLTRLDIHPLIMNTAGEVILEQVFRKGICLYGRDSGQLRIFRRNKLSMIAEFDYYTKLMQMKLRQRYGVQAHG